MQWRLSTRIESRILSKPWGLRQSAMFLRRFITHSWFIWSMRTRLERSYTWSWITVQVASCFITCSGLVAFQKELQNSMPLAFSLESWSFIGITSFIGSKPQILALNWIVAWNLRTFWLTRQGTQWLQILDWVRTKLQIALTVSVGLLSTWHPRSF